MDVRVYNELLKWSDGKPLVLGLVGPKVAFGADALYRLVASEEGRELCERFQEQRHPKWNDYYPSMVELLHDQPESFYPDWAPRVPDLEQLQRNPEQLEQTLTVWCKRLLINEPDEEAKVWLQSLYRELATGITPEESESAQAEAESNAATRFFASIVVPYILHHRESPQESLSRVASNPSRHVGDLEHLTANDALFVTDTVAEPLFRTPDGAARLRLVAPSLESGSKQLTRREVIDAAAGFVSFVSHSIDAPLQAPEISRLLDLAEDARQGEASMGELDQPATPEAKQKMLVRQRRTWQAWLDPDNKIPTYVRALKQAAA